MAFWIRQVSPEKWNQEHMYECDCVCVCVCVCVCASHIQAWNPRRAKIFSLSLKAGGWEGKDNIPAQRQTGRRNSLLLGRGQSFCSFQTFNWLGETHPLRGGQSALLSLLIQMLISTWNIRSDTCRNNAWANVWVLCGPVKQTHKINYHTFGVILRFKISS